MKSASYVNENEWRVLALRRSGHHAVIHWIISQCPGPGLFLNDCQLLSDGRLLGNRFSRYFNLPPGQAERDLCGLELASKQLYLYNFEDLAPGQFHEAAARAQPRGESRRRLDIVVIRDPFNWAASRRQAEPDLDLDAAGLLECWKQQARLAQQRKDEAGFLAVYFSRWVAEQDYRHKVCRKLGLPFTDAGFREVELPGISSFDAEVADDNQVVLQRWKKRVWDEDYRRWMQDEELLRLAQDAGAQTALELFRHAARPGVSVVVPIYNRAHLIGETIQSVQSQTRPDWELLIADDGSDDNTEEVIRGFADPRIRYFRLPPNRSMTLTRNKGLSESRGRWIAFLDSDDLWDPHKLELQIEMLKCYPQAQWSWTGYVTFNQEELLNHNNYAELDGLSGQSEQVQTCNLQGVEKISESARAKLGADFDPGDPATSRDADGTEAPVAYEIFLGNVLNDLARTRFVIYTSTVLFSRALLKQVGPLDERLPWGDFDYFVRLAEHSRALVVKNELASIRKHEGNTAGTSPIGFKEAISSLRAARRRGSLDKSLYRRSLARLQRNFGLSLMIRGHPWKGRKSILASFLLHPRMATLKLLGNYHERMQS